jgi:hypothetical protein
MKKHRVAKAAHVAKKSRKGRGSKHSAKKLAIK